MLSELYGFLQYNLSGSYASQVQKNIDHVGSKPRWNLKAKRPRTHTDHHYNSEYFQIQCQADTQAELKTMIDELMGCQTINAPTMYWYYTDMPRWWYSALTTGVYLEYKQGFDRVYRDLYYGVTTLIVDFTKADAVGKVANLTVQPITPTVGGGSHNSIYGHWDTYTPDAETIWIETPWYEDQHLLSINDAGWVAGTPFTFQYTIPQATYLHWSNITNLPTYSFSLAISITMTSTPFYYVGIRKVRETRHHAELEVEVRSAIN